MCHIVVHHRLALGARDGVVVLAHADRAPQQREAAEPGHALAGRRGGRRRGRRQQLRVAE